MTSEVEFVGDEAAMADLRRWGEQLGPAVLKAAEPFGTRLADQVRGRVPHLTGLLASTLESSADDEAVSVGYDGGAPYDGWIEFGGSRGRAYSPEGRYLYPAATDAADDFEKVAADTASDTVGRFAWSQPAV